MKPGIAIVFFDIDGTLISFTTHSMPKTTLEALQTLRSKSVKLVVATGRPRKSIGFLDEFFQFDAYITSNGMNCYTPSEPIFKNAFRRQDIEVFLEFLEKNPFPCLFSEDQEIFINYIDDFVRNSYSLTNLSLPEVADPKRALDCEIFQLVAYLTRETEGVLMNKLDFLNPERALPTCIDITPRGGGKTVGIEKVLEYYGLNVEQAMAFGDAENDIGMLEKVRLGVAMGNAVEQVKGHAAFVTDHVDCEGIYKALRHFELL